MRIDRLRVKNFRGFEEAEFEFAAHIEDDGSSSNGSFHVFIGDNATGKTALLEALSRALGSYTVAFPDGNAQYFHPADTHVRILEADGEYRTVEILPIEVEAWGKLEGQPVNWTRRKTNVRTSDSGAMRRAAEGVYLSGSKDLHHPWPLIGYYGTSRLHDLLNDTWSRSLRDAGKSADLNIPQESRPLSEKQEKTLFKKREAGYWYANESRTNPQLLQQWLHTEAVTAFHREKASKQFTVVLEAIKHAVIDCTDVRFNGSLGLLVKTKDHPFLPFDRLSEGQRDIVAIVGDLAWKASQLNPGFGFEVLRQTKGIVLIDEIDLHLHPRWQRRIVNDLRTIFPQVQFIATTHSPFIVQSLRDGELHQLSTRLGTISNTQNQSIETIAKALMVPAPDEPVDKSAELMGVSEPEVSKQYGEMKGVAADLFKLIAELDDATPQRRDDIERQMATVMGRAKSYPDNPAFQAFLEMKRAEALKG